MNVLDKVARALKTGTPGARPEPGQLFHCVGKVAIEAFLETAAEQGWHMRPDEATEEMGEAWAKLALDRIQKAVEGEMQTVGMVKGAKENYCAMLDAAPEFKWKDDS